MPKGTYITNKGLLLKGYLILGEDSMHTYRYATCVSACN